LISKSLVVRLTYSTWRRVVL